MMKLEDKRVRRTKKLLREALTALMQEKDFKDITVTDLVERADINRGTFYVYYRDVYDLREKIEDEMIEDCREMIGDYMPCHVGQSLRPMLQRAVDYVEENREIACSLLRTSGAYSFEAKMMEIVEQSRLAILKRRDKKAETYAARFVAGGVVCMMEKWLADPNPMPKNVLVDMMDELLQRTMGELPNLS